ncbi:competence type IV pilus minor pilin ComGD [Bacillus sp. FJAT-27225]|uniref:competence type IV pilus minor pilin ComGD n=1 Tax=Bacillus sp. FJAT-27225 TaxID=1743144 RepID=UPI0009822A8A|nr:competence type IV pilus minor pilin ComGD [Bacillus sp. FJAT-27225]
MAEALISLAGFIMIISLCVSLMKPLHSASERQHFFSLLKADLYYTQLYAISHQRDQNFIIMGEKNLYYVDNTYVVNLLIKRIYPAAFQITPGTMPLNFKFLPDGNVNRFGTILVRKDGRYYRLVFQLGKGRFYVAEG